MCSSFGEISLQMFHVFPALVISERDDIGSGLHNVSDVPDLIAQYRLIDEWIRGDSSEPLRFIIARAHAFDTRGRIIARDRNNEMRPIGKRASLPKKVLMTRMDHVESPEYHYPRHIEV